MATKSLTATIFGVDKASPAFDAVSKSAGEMADDTEKAGGRMGSAMKKGAAMAAGALAAVGFADFVKDTIAQASAMEQNMGAMQSVFKEAAGEIEKFGETSATTVGIAKQDYYQLAAVFGSQLKNMGVAVTDLAPKTNQLVTLGADLAAVYGGSASDAVEAISSLLRGERDPIERYGISIKQASINAYEMANGLDTSTASAKTNSDMQATLALLFQQTADAQGQFAAQTDTLAESQQIANAKFAEAKAEIGAKLLPVVTDLTNFAADKLVPVLGMVADGLGKALDVIGSIPGPVKVALAALLAFKLFQQTETFSKLAAGARGFREEMALQRGLASAQGVELSQMGAAATTARMRVGALAKSLGKAGALAAGIWVASQIVEGFNHVNQSMEAVKQSAQDLGKQLLENNNIWDESIQKSYEQSVVNSDVFQALIKDGADYGKTLAALTGQTGLYTDSVQEVSKHMGALSADQVLAIGGLLGLKDATKAASASLAQYQLRQKIATGEYVDAQDEARSAAVATAAAYREYALVTGQAATVQDEARSGAEQLKLEWLEQSDANHDAKDAAFEWMSQAAAVPDTAGDMTAALKAFSDQTNAANTRLKFFGMEVDKLAGRDISLEQATKLLNDQTRALTEGFTDARKSTKNHAAALIEADGAINTTTEAGSKLYDTVSNYREAYDAATTAARDHAQATGTNVDALNAARAAADEARATFLEQAKALGVSREDAIKMADAMGILEGKKLTAKTLGLFLNDQVTDELDDIDERQLKPKTLRITAEVSGATGENIFVTASGAKGMALGGWVRGAAGGEWITGGIPGRDSVLRALMPGEAVIPRHVAQRNRPLINSLMSGGSVAGGGPVVVEIMFRGDGVITREMARTATVAIAGERRDATVRFRKAVR